MAIPIDSGTNPVLISLDPEDAPNNNGYFCVTDDTYVVGKINSTCTGSINSIVPTVNVFLGVIDLKKMNLFSFLSIPDITAVFLMANRTDQGILFKPPVKRRMSITGDTGLFSAPEEVQTSPFNSNYNYVVLDKKNRNQDL